MICDSRNQITYFLHEEYELTVKIGTTIGDVRERRDDLQTGNSRKLWIFGAITDDGERDLHKDFADLCVRGEWFHIRDELLTFLILLTKSKEFMSWSEWDSPADLIQHLAWLDGHNEPETIEIPNPNYQPRPAKQLSMLEPQPHIRILKQAWKANQR
jgi:hypothetical protein